MAFCRITLELGIDLSRLSLHVGVALLHVALTLFVLIPSEKFITIQLSADGRAVSQKYKNI